MLGQRLLKMMMWDIAFSQINIYLGDWSLNEKFHCDLNSGHHLLLYLEPSAPSWSSSSVLDHISLPPVFESRRRHIWRLFRLSLRLITFGSRSAHLDYLVHKSGRKTSIIIYLEPSTEVDYCFEFVRAYKLSTGKS